MTDELVWTELDESNAPAWVKGFLAALQLNPNVTMACRAVGIARSTPYEYRKLHPNFEIPWSEAEAEGADVLENAAWERAVNGCDRPVYQGGAMVGTVTEYSDTLTALLLKAHKPSKYRDNKHVEHSGTLSIEQLRSQIAERSKESKARDEEIDDSLTGVVDEES